MKNNYNILYKSVVGSHLYGMNTPKSDIDTKGVFILENEKLLTIDNYIEDVADEKNDNTLIELNKFGRLLHLNNPNILELLYAPNELIIKKDELFNLFINKRDSFLSKKCKYTFGGYSISQIRKAAGLNKKIVNPVDKKKKTPLHFCYVMNNNGSLRFDLWLKKQKGNRSKQEYYGLQKINNMHNLYNLFYDEDKMFRGVVNIENTSNTIRLSSIPKEYTKENILFFNEEGYSKYLKDYTEYWNWVEKRNPNRYNDNIKNKHNYDGKNMMHCVRLLDVGINIAKERTVLLEPTNKDLLFKIRYGQLPYEYIMKIVEDKQQELNEVYDNCDLPETTNLNKINDIILNIREFYFNK